MAKQIMTTHQVFEDLENYLNFCRAYGYKYDESDLYSQRSYAYRQFQKLVAGKPAKNQWDADSSRVKDNG